jgi:CRP-like cAMP-binding protein
MEDNLMELHHVLRKIELFDGLDEQELAQVSKICQRRSLQLGEKVTTEGDEGDEMFIVTEGFVEVTLGDPELISSKSLVNLGAGQIFGEMALVDRGPRSATVRAISDPTKVQVIKRDDFEKLCRDNAHIGFIIMRNIVIDLSIKLRHRNLSERE